MSKKIQTNYCDEGIQSLYFKSIVEGSLVIFKNNKGEHEAINIVHVSPFGANETNILGKKRNDPVIMITGFFNSEKKTFLIIFDKKIKKFKILKTNQEIFEILEIVKP